MEKLVLWLARLSAIIGLLLFGTAVVTRLNGIYTIASFQVGTLLLAGLAAAMLGSLAYLAVLVELRQKR